MGFIRCDRFGAHRLAPRLGRAGFACVGKGEGSDGAFQERVGPLTPVGRETQWQVVAKRRTEMSDEDFFFEVSIPVCFARRPLSHNEISSKVHTAQ